MKYSGPIEKAPPEIRAAAEIIWADSLPSEAWVDIDTENRPGWISVTAKASDVAQGKIDAAFPQTVSRL